MSAPGSNPQPPFREVVTIDEENMTLERRRPPVDVSEAGSADGLRVVKLFDPELRPSNAERADGKPLRLFDSPALKIDVSKRSAEDMSFWHRNADRHEVILCLKGQLVWETELGIVTLAPGEMLLIPRGITHRSRLVPGSEGENVLLELKIDGPLRYVGTEQ